MEWLKLSRWRDGRWLFLLPVYRMMGQMSVVLRKFQLRKVGSSSEGKRLHSTVK